MVIDNKNPQNIAFEIILLSCYALFCGFDSPDLGPFCFKIKGTHTVSKKI